MSGIDDDVLVNLERRYASGLTSGDLLGLCSEHGLQLSEATLRKYVQLGLLPRSIRVGRKGKHKGSLGVYPVRALRQLVRIKELLANSYTIEEIRRDFSLVQADIDQLEQTLSSIFKALGRILVERGQDQCAPRVKHEVSKARRQGRELVAQLSSIEGLLAQSRLSHSNVAVGAVRAAS